MKAQLTFEGTEMQIKNLRALMRFDTDYLPNLVTPKKEDAVYIEYLNKDKKHQKDKIEFDSFDHAVLWGKKNLDNFNTDIIQNR